MRTPAFLKAGTDDNTCIRNISFLAPGDPSVGGAKSSLVCRTTVQNWTDCAGCVKFSISSPPCPVRCKAMHPFRDVMGAKKAEGQSDGRERKACFSELFTPEFSLTLPYGGVLGVQGSARCLFTASSTPFSTGL